MFFKSFSFSKCMLKEHCRRSIARNRSWRLISAAGQSRSRSWRKCADIIGRTVLKFHERSCRSNFIFLAHFCLLFTLSITLKALQALFLATFQKPTPSYVTSDYVAFLALYWLYKVNKVMCDFPDVVIHQISKLGRRGGSDNPET